MCLGILHFIKYVLTFVGNLAIIPGKKCPKKEGGNSEILHCLISQLASLIALFLGQFDVVPSNLFVLLRIKISFQQILTHSP